jgi:hypothetical protein
VSAVNCSAVLLLPLLLHLLHLVLVIITNFPFFLVPPPLQISTLWGFLYFFFYNIFHSAFMRPSQKKPAIGMFLGVLA